MGRAVHWRPNPAHRFGFLGFGPCPSAHVPVVPTRDLHLRVHEFQGARVQGGGRHVVQARQVHAVNASPVGADDQVVFSLLHDQVMHRHAGQIAVQRTERCAGIGGEVGAAVGAHHPPSRMIFQLDQGIDGFRRQVLAPTLPRFPAVACRKHPRVQCVVPVPVQRHHKQVGVVVRPHHFCDPGVLDAVALAERGGDGHVQLGPGVPPVHRHVHEAVVAAHRQLAKPLRVFCQGGQGSERHVASTSATGQVTAEGFPGFTLVHGTVKLVGPHVQDVLLVPAQQDGRLPIPPERSLSQRVGGVQACGFPCGQVGPAVPPKLVAREHDVRVPAVDFDLHAVASAQAAVGVLPRLVPGGVFLVRVRAFPCAVVLQSPVDVVRFGVVHLDGVKLAHAWAVALDPGGAAVPRHVHAAVVAVEHVPRVVGVDPNFVVVDVDIRGANVLKRLTSVGRLQQGHPRDVHGVDVRRVDAHRAEVIAISVPYVVQPAFVGASPRAVLEGVQFRADNFCVKQRCIPVGEVIVKGPRREFGALDTGFDGRRAVGGLEPVLVQVGLQGVVVQGQEGLGRHVQKRRGGQSTLLCSSLVLGPGGLVVDEGVQGVGCRMVGEADSAGVGAFGKTVEL